MAVAVLGTQWCPFVASRMTLCKWGRGDGDGGENEVAYRQRTSLDPCGRVRPDVCRHFRGEREKEGGRRGRGGGGGGRTRQVYGISGGGRLRLVSGDLHFGFGGIGVGRTRLAVFAVGA